MKKTARMPLRVVFYRDESDKSVWVAHCLEFDLMGHGSTQRDAAKMLADAIIIQLKNTVRTGNYKNLFTAAPAEYQWMYANGRDKADAELKIVIHEKDFEVEDTDVREYDDEFSESDSDCAVALGS